MCAESRSENVNNNRCEAVEIFRKYVNIIRRHIFNLKNCIRQISKRGLLTRRCDKNEVRKKINLIVIFDCR